jgi:hypothetical protein
MNLVLLCVSSIFLGRFLERRMKVASIAHSILFIVASFFFLFDSGFKIIDYAMINIFGEEIFYVMQESLRSASNFYGIAFSALFVLEFISYYLICIVAIIAVIKGFRKIIERWRIRKLVLLRTEQVEHYSPLIREEISYQGTYLVLAHLRN